jgi:hypothetical protein
MPVDEGEMSHFKDQLETMRTHPGFIAALDQSGGSTPHALRAYGIKEDAWSTEEQMLAIVHHMRTRIITSPAFTGDRIIGAILFENTIDRDIEGQATADYLWNVKRVVPFLKVDKGLAVESRGVQLMKPMPERAALLDKAKAKRIFGTKWRRGSVVASWLLDLSAAALIQDPELKGFQGRVSDSGEGRWTIRAAIDEAVPTPVLSTTPYERFSSRGEADFGDKLLSAMRYEFGGHREKPSE